MKLMPYTPTAVLVVALAAIQLSGNDKAPFLLAMPLVLSVAVFILMLARPYKWPLRLLSLLPWIYIAGAAALSRAGIISSALTLGFR